MPKQVDHHARRLELLDALMRIASRDGWDAISLRHVAAEAGVSMGMVQHYFTTKDQMLRFAVEMMALDTRERIRARVAALPPPLTPRVLVGTVLTEMIPDAERRPAEADAAGIWVRRFLLTPDSRAALRQGFEDVRGMLIEQIRLARPGRSPAAAERDALGLIAMVDGLIYNLVTGYLTTPDATAVLDAQLDRVLGTPSDHSGPSAPGAHRPT